MIHSHPKPTLEYLEVADLKWRLIERNRQSWTFFSLAVLAFGLWVLAHGSETPVASTLGWTMGAASLVVGFAGFLTQRSMRRIQNQLKRRFSSNTSSGKPLSYGPI